MGSMRAHSRCCFRLLCMVCVRRVRELKKVSIEHMPPARPDAQDTGVRRKRKAVDSPGTTLHSHSSGSYYVVMVVVGSRGAWV